MAGNKLIFQNTEEAKLALMDLQKLEIAGLYEEWAKDIKDMANYYRNKTTSSAPLSERYYRELQNQITKTSQQISNEVYRKVRSNIYIISDDVVKDNIKWLKSLGFTDDTINVAFSYVPDNVVRRLVTGQIYESGWSLSQRIWGDNEDTLKDIYEIIAGGVAKQQSIYETAKQLEKFVNPNAAKQWNLTDKDGRKIYPKKVDYNAQRLARTLVQHSYQQSFIEVTKNNPLITKYIWRSTGSRACPLCQDRDGKIYEKDELPMDHPNGMCTMEPYIAENYLQRISGWLNNPKGYDLELDRFAEELGYRK